MRIEIGPDPPTLPGTQPSRFVRSWAMRSRSVRSLVLALLGSLAPSPHAVALDDPLPSWNEGPAKQAIVDFVRTTTDAASPRFVPPEARIAVFDQDGTTWVYQPMLEVMKYLRANGYKTYIVTGGGQDFVRVYSERVYGIPPEQVVGTIGGTKFGYDSAGRPTLTKEPRLLLNDDSAGKPQGIHLMIGRRPYAAFGNSVGDRQMLEYTGAGAGARLMMLVLHDDDKREYAYGPAQKLPDTKVGRFPQALVDEAKKKGWTVIHMKSDWKRIFAFEP